MKGLLSALALTVLFSTLALASPARSQTKLTPVKATHHRRDPRVTRHRAHKAVKHHAPKHHRRAI